jgi:hypothetical protein
MAWEWAIENTKQGFGELIVRGLVDLFVSRSDVRGRLGLAGEIHQIETNGCAQAVVIERIQFETRFCSEPGKKIRIGHPTFSDRRAEKPRFRRYWNGLFSL